MFLEKWIFHKDVPVLDENQKPVLEDGKPLMQKIELDKPIVNYFRVFNGEQVTGLPELQKQLEACGFRPTENLIKNTEQFSKLEGRRYSLRELADLSRFKQNFNGDIQKQECFEAIVKECREQELDKLKEIPKTGFLSQEMMEEMALLPDA